MKTFHLVLAVQMAFGAAFAFARAGTDVEQSRNAGPAGAAARSLPADLTPQQQWSPPGPRMPVVPTPPPGWGEPPTPTAPQQPYTPPQPYVPPQPYTPVPHTPSQPRTPRYSPIPDILPPQATVPPQAVMPPQATMPPGGPQFRQTFLCSHCRRELPAGVRAGDRCPYCGTYLAYEKDASGKVTHTVPVGNLPIGKYLLIGGLIPVGAIVIGLVIWFVKNI
jgi:hypothetical protein